MDNRFDNGRGQQRQGDYRNGQQAGCPVPRVDAGRRERAVSRIPEIDPQVSAGRPHQSQNEVPRYSNRPQNGGPHQPNQPLGGAPDRVRQSQTGMPRQLHQAQGGDYRQPKQIPEGHPRQVAERTVARSQRDGGQPGCRPPAAGASSGGFAAGGSVAVPSAGQYSRANYGSAMQQKKEGGPWKVVLAGSVIVFLAALIALGVILFSYWQGRSVYDEVAETGFNAPDDVAGVQLADLQVDWDALRAINADVVAWVYMPGTNINYPIVHGDDNEYYLTHDFKGSEGWLATFGTVFLEASNAADFSDQNNVMYGHNMNDGSMFSDIASLADAQAFNDHRTVFVLTPQGNYRLTTFSLVHCAATDPLVKTSFASSSDYQEYVQDKIDRSVNPASDIVSASDMTKTFAFSTCDNLPSDGRYVLFGYVVETTVSGVQVPNDAGNAVGAVGEDESTELESAVEDAVAA